MKCKIFSLLLAISTFAYAATEDSFINTKNKMYVQPNDIAFKDNAIYVLVNQNWVKTNSVHSDAAGVFVDSSKIGWTCSFCGWYNTESLYYCSNPSCGRQRN